MIKKTSLLLSFLISIFGFSQIKSTPVISLGTDMTAKFTLDNATSKVNLELTGPSNNWTSLRLGTSSSTSGGDTFLYTSSITENTVNSVSPKGEWQLIANTTTATKRTVLLERTLTNAELNDLQLDFNTTNTIDIVWSRSGSVIVDAPNPNRGFTTGVFEANLSLDDASLYDEVLLYPNPSTGELVVQTKTALSKIIIYSNTGTLIKTINNTANFRELKVDTSDLPHGLYIFELQNEFEKTWKKVIVN